MSQRKFLTAEWRKLIMANYEIDPGILKKYIPAGAELDTWENKYYVSLVGFMFLKTKLRGITIPFHSNFPEVNLRFYVRYKSGNDWKRGVVFINEFVPKAAITFIANNLYKERYVTCTMKHKWEIDERLTIGYYWKKDNKWNELEVIADPKLNEIKLGSKEEFITEHYWGYTKVGSTRTSEYAVEHPRWRVYPVTDYKIEVNFGGLYGAQFAFL
ncbi:MAG TPA: DUF2071 domain-containing protein, partial [Chitinophagaceae bacterium]